MGTADDFNKKSAEQLASERAMTTLGMFNENMVVALPEGEINEEDQ
jgi:hypothetical protein